MPKSKLKKNSKIKNINSLPLNLESKPIDKYGYPIHKFETCFRCGKEFCLTFSFSQQNYSRKHFWFYWTEQESDKDKHICSPCLRNTYLQEKRFYLESVKNIKKKRILSDYISSNFI